MCKCLESPGSPIWGATCKCTHARVRLMGERVVVGSIIRSWICDMPGCYRAWDVNMNFGSQAELEGRV